ncbi:tail fiber assembly protein [Burkholderia glumae]|uniref:tail fiber assembly protein n=1 Tax=Burkholderia glumae TaxID=337 RepID=UPI002150D9A1|nr:tail fiber assembly protein [Burkholderia glumae]
MGQKYAAYDEQHNIVGFYDSQISPLAEGAAAIKITDEEWQMLLDGQSKRRRMALDTSLQPVLLEPPPPTREQIVAMNSAERDALLEQASVALAPLQMAVSLDEAADTEIALAKAWIAFSRSVKAVDLTKMNPAWPSKPIAG